VRLILGEDGAHGLIEHGEHEAECAQTWAASCRCSLSMLSSSGLLMEDWPPAGLENSGGRGSSATGVDGCERLRASFMSEAADALKLGVLNTPLSSPPSSSTLHKRPK
jgi:hypothetical protein